MKIDDLKSKSMESNDEKVFFFLFYYYILQTPFKNHVFFLIKTIRTYINEEFFFLNLIASCYK